MRVVLYGHNRTERLAHVSVPGGSATSPLITIQRCGITDPGQPATNKDDDEREERLQ